MLGIRPEAGAAVFWYNLQRSGEADRLTLHGACPVLFGTKWGIKMTKNANILIFYEMSFQLPTNG